MLDVNARDLLLWDRAGERIVVGKSENVGIRGLRGGRYEWQDVVEVGRE